MDQVTFKIDGEEIEELTEEADERGQSRSHYIREIVTSRHDDDALRAQVERLQDKVKEQQADHEERVADIHEEYDEEIERLQTKIDRLERTNLKILEQREESTQLQRYVDDQREWQQANWFTRQKWKLLGRADA